ncbi:hypothetical protein BCIN_02g00650 [Botrytis cinerea B05.10]|uniref:Uncharacterized protein n=1 Tax=Botryotinia fuckeliana (strain B05.10) TaxID=332648 RepID=A0A384J8M5_BOTFB|nr:hypothetical protein BCIN_02g00650 [Botrytis cinerea B05.10]ATZ46684.1 hypothetical protein BCIN_02g00650 [Botrytis cinerea B05.10]
MGNGKWEVGIKIEIERLLAGESESIIKERKDSWERYHCRRGKHKTRSKSKLVLERPTELEVKTRDPFTRGRMGIHSISQHRALQMRLLSTESRNASFRTADHS